MIDVTCVTIDCRDPVKLAAFWAEALRWEQAPNEWDGSLNLVRPPHDGWPYLEFIEVPEPKTVKNRMHLGLHAGDLAAEIARLESLGASCLWEELFGEGVPFRNVVMCDPEGNEFCLSGPGPRPHD